MADSRLIQVVSRRRQGVNVSVANIRGLLAEEVNCFRTTTDDHAAWWNSSSWLGKAGWSQADRRNIRALAGWLQPRHPTPGPDWRLISRKDVFDRARIGYDDVFLLAVLAWGYGTTNDRFGYIPTATGSARSLGVGQIAQTMKTAAASSPVAVFQAWSPRGPAKIAGLGPSFASKLAYFACYNRSQGRGPLIADENTAWAYWLLTLDAGSREKPAPYGRYVAWCEREASILRCRSDDVERALFNLGKEVRQIYKRL